MSRSSPPRRLHRVEVSQVPRAALHSGCVLTVQSAGVQAPPTLGASHTAKLVMAARSKSACQRMAKDHNAI